MATFAKFISMDALKKTPHKSVKSSQLHLRGFSMLSCFRHLLLAAIFWFRTMLGNANANGTAAADSRHGVVETVQRFISWCLMLTGTSSVMRKWPCVCFKCVCEVMRHCFTHLPTVWPPQSVCFCHNCVFSSRPVIFSTTTSCFDTNFSFFLLVC